MRHLLSIADVSKTEAISILDTANELARVSDGAVKKLPTLRGRTIVNLFAEDSTRTRISFEAAAKRLSADVINFSSKGSSVSKGESLKDTAMTLQAMGADAVVIRHSASGAAQRLADSQWMSGSVINAGDGTHEHPSQALLDAFTIRKAPPTLVPVGVESWPCTVSYDFDAVIPFVDVVMMLRVQQERMTDFYFPNAREYSRYFGLNIDRMKSMKTDSIVMHPGPMNRGLEISAEVADSARSVITEQVTNGVSVRMAILYVLLTGGALETGIN